MDSADAAQGYSGDAERIARYAANMMIEALEGVPTDRISMPAYPGGFGDLDKYPALVLHYSGGGVLLRFSA
jgi:hypothetical protein